MALSPGLGGKRITSILARNDLLSRAPVEFLSLNAEVLREEYRLPATVAAHWAMHAKQLMDEAALIEERFSRLGIGMVTAADAHYPSRIEAIMPNPPGMLFHYGNCRLLDGKTFAVFCSRKASAKDLEEIEKLTEQGVLRGEILVSGHDTPEYQRSAVVPLRWGSPRILVLDRGFEAALGEDLREEPFRAARLWRYEFDPATDLVLSPVRPEKGYHVSGNQLRDQLIAGLALRMEFVSVRPGGNMERLRRAAHRARRLSVTPCAAEV